MMEGHDNNVNEELLTNESVPIVIQEFNMSEDINFVPMSIEEGVELRSKKLRHLRSILEKDSRAIDMKWSLFVAACQSYRFDTVLRPFPPAFVKDGVKDIELLVLLIVLLYHYYSYEKTFNH